VADGWCWFVLREKYCWLVAGGWFVAIEKYCWLVADKPSEQGESQVMTHPIAGFCCNGATCPACSLIQKHFARHRLSSFQSIESKKKVTGRVASPRLRYMLFLPFLFP
jgi:hypothetical protein